MFLALVPIILIEWIVLTRFGAQIWESLLAVSVANLGSTLVGIPLAIVLEIVVATNTPLYEESWDPKDTWIRDWMLPAGGVLLLIPFFLMSWWIEAPITAWFLDDLPTQFVDSAVRDANLVTYGLLAALLWVMHLLVVRDTRASDDRNRYRGARFEHDTASHVPGALANDHANVFNYGPEGRDTPGLWDIARPVATGQTPPTTPAPLPTPRITVSWTDYQAFHSAVPLPWV